MTRCRRRGAVLVLLVASVAASAAACREERPAPPPPQAFSGDLVGSHLPPLDVREWLVPRGQSEGRDTHPLVILFWNYQDNASLEAIDFLAGVALAHAAEGLRVITIHTEIGAEDFQTTQGARDAIAARRIALPTALDRGTATLAKCRVFEVPSLVFVDRSGIVRGVLANYRRSRQEAIVQFIEERLLL